MLSVGIVGAGIRGKLFADALRDQAGVEVVGFAEPAAVMAESARAATNLPLWPSHPHLGPPPAPVVGLPLRVADVQERLPGEEAPLGELHPRLDPPLVLRRADPRRVDRDAAGLRVLQPLPVPPRLQPVRRVRVRADAGRACRADRGDPADRRITGGGRRGRGIEETSERDLLAELGCRLGQGYLYSRPVGLAQAQALIVAGPLIR